MMKTPMARAAYRGMIHHAMEHADMHVRAMEDGHVADEMKPMHRAMAMRALDGADEMHEMMRSAFIGNNAKQDVVVDATSGPTDGEIYNLPRTADAEMSARFAAVATKVGKLPRSLRGIVQAELGTVDGEIVEEKLLGLKGVQERYVSLQTEHARGLASVEKAATEKLIEEALDGQFVTPAEAKRFRGIDPATGAATGQPWGKARVERFVEERRQLGPVADIKRPGAQRSVQQDEAAHNVAKKPSLIRAGFGVQRTATEQEQGAMVADIAAQMEARYGIKLPVADILSRTAEAAELPNSEGAESIKRATGVK